MLLHTRRRVGPSLLHHLIESRSKPLSPMILNPSRSISTTEPRHTSFPLPTAEFSMPSVFFVKNDDVPGSMFMRFTPSQCPPLQILCDESMEIILLIPRIAQPAVARHCLAQLILRGTLPDLVTFSILLKSYCKDPHLTYHHVHHLVFTEMKAMGVEADDSFYRTLVDVVCSGFGPALGCHLLKDLGSSCPIQLPLSCYDKVVRRFCKKKMVENEAMVLLLIDLLIYMKQQRVFPDGKIFKFQIRGRDHGGEGFLKALSIGGQMLALAIKIKATVAKK